jgi:hypothetical protein
MKAGADRRDGGEDLERRLIEVTAALSAARRRCEELEAQILAAKAFLASTELQARAPDPLVQPNARTTGIPLEKGAQGSDSPSTSCAKATSFTADGAATTAKVFLG